MLPEFSVALEAHARGTKVTVKYGYAKIVGGTTKDISEFFKGMAARSWAVEMQSRGRDLRRSTPRSVPAACEVGWVLRGLAGADPPATLPTLTGCQHISSDPLASGVLVNRTADEGEEAAIRARAR